MTAGLTRALGVVGIGVALGLLLCDRGAAQDVAPPAPQLKSTAAILIEPETRQVLHELNADDVRPPASLTKMMTALLVAESGDLGRVVEVSPTAATVGETSMHLTAGERISLYDLLLGVLLPSANDAAVACAEAVDGSIEAFVAHMNRRAAELGMTRTRFANPHGLHEDEHLSSARDLAILGAAVMARPELREIVRMKQATVPWPGHDGPRVLVNRNRLLERWDACDGIKTGYTRQAGRCLAASAFVDGWRLICVVLSSKDAWGDAERLLRWGFNSHYKVALVSSAVTTATVEVRGGVAPTVRARAAQDVIVVLPRTARPPDPVLLDTSCSAPVELGEVVGRLAVAMPDGGTRTVDLIALAEVAQSPWAMIMEHRWSLAALTAVLALAVGVLAHGAIAEALGARRSG